METTCPGSLLQAIHPKKSATEPFYGPKDGPALLQDYPETLKTIEELTEFDANDNVPKIIGHYGNLLNILEFFSTAVNEKGWGEAGTWRFLQDFRQSVALSSP